MVSAANRSLALGVGHVRGRILQQLIASEVSWAFYTTHTCIPCFVLTYLESYLLTLAYFTSYLLTLKPLYFYLLLYHCAI